MNEKNIFILFSHKTIANRLLESIIVRGYKTSITTTDNLKLKTGDIVILDAHIGTQKEDLEGLAFFNKLRSKRIPNKIILLSWYSIELLIKSGKYYTGDYSSQFLMEENNKSVYLILPINSASIIEYID